jgi:ATP-binding cassette, subfamily B, multidrug efflux pump
MRPDYGYSEEGHLGKPHDLRLLKRLWPFLRPYRRMLAGSLVLVVFLTLLGLALPYFSKVAIDRYIVPVQRTSADTVAADGPVEHRFLIVDVDDPQVRAIVERHAGLFETRSDTARIRYADLNRLPRADLMVLRRDAFAGLGWMVVLFLGLVAADFGLTFTQRVIMERAGHTVMHDLRLRIFDHVQQQSMAFFTRQPVARLVTRATNDVQNMHELFTTFVSMVFRDIFMVVGVAVVLMVLQWHLALAALAVMPVVAWTAVRFSALARDVFRALRIKLAEINGRIAETIDGIRAIQTYAQEKNNYERFARLNEENYRLGMREIHVFGLFMPTIEMLGILAMALMLWYGGLQVLEGRISLGVLVVALSYVRMFFRPMRDLAENYNVLQNAMASAERIFGILDTDERLPQPAPQDVGQPPPPQFTALVLDRVSFAYAPGEPILQDVTFTVSKGQTTALVGPTGAGKTSLLNLIQRFYDPTSGQVLLNGIDLRQWDPTRLRSMIALVTQDPVLFTASVRRNIFADPDKVDERTAANIVAAANCGALIERLPRGLDTLLEKGGAGLSSGERQLITIARALARNAQLILLDEATSYIDSQTEEAIYDALRNLIVGRTCVLVAHRLSTARMADRIIVLHRGRVAEEGSHEQLMAQGKLYWRLYQQQDGGRETENSPGPPAAAQGRDKRSLKR